MYSSKQMLIFAGLLSMVGLFAAKKIKQTEQNAKELFSTDNRFSSLMKFDPGLLHDVLLLPKELLGDKSIQQHLFHSNINITPENVTSVSGMIDSNYFQDYIQQSGVII